MQLFAENSLSDVSATEVAIQGIDKFLNLGRWKINVDLRSIFTSYLPIWLLKSFLLLLKNDSVLTCSIQLSLIQLLSAASNRTLSKQKSRKFHWL